MNRDRINLRMSIEDAVVVLVEGNVGALTVCLNLLKEYPRIDPDAAFGGLTGLFNLDTNRIYGPRIYMLYKDVCHGSYVNMIAILRGVQLGLLSQEKLSYAIDNRGEGIDIDSIVQQIKLQLPAFVCE